MKTRLNFRVLDLSLYLIFFIDSDNDHHNHILTQYSEQWKKESSEKSLKTKLSQ